MHIQENALTSFHSQIIRHYNLLYNLSYHLIPQMTLAIVIQDIKASFSTVNNDVCSLRKVGVVNV